MTNQSFPVSDLRIVRLVYMSGETDSNFYMSVSEVDRFVQASIELHHTGGNPHNGRGLEGVARLKEIWVVKLDPPQAYWWTTPDLRSDPDTNGAKVMTYWGGGECVWRHPDVNKIVRLYDMMDGWIDITGPVTQEEANRIWNEYTGNGTHNTSYPDGDYYAIFPADTKMLYTPEMLGR